MNIGSDSKILLAGFKFSHHSDSSGYHQLVNYIDCDYLDANKIPFGKFPIGSKLKQINFLLFESYLSFKAKKYDIVHYFYPEQHLIYSPFSNKKGISVATIHLDENWLDKNVSSDRVFVEMRRKAFQKLDGIISLSKEQANRLSKIFPEKNIKFIPHGVKDLAKYGDINWNDVNKYITIVGSNYRDKKTLFEIINYARDNEPTWRFNLIGLSKEWKEEASYFSNCIVHPFLSENDYFKILQSSHLHLLPVEFATANNALLEAHSLGVPTIASNIQGISDYSLESTGHFNNVSEAIMLINNILKMDKFEYEKLRFITSQQARKFLWKSVAKEVEGFYEELINKRRFKN